MSRWKLNSVLLGVLGATFGLGPALPLARGDEAPATKPVAEQAAEKPKFVRVERDDEGNPQSMQTAIVSFSDPQREDGPVVDLVGAIHVGEKSYYEALNQLFTNYDAVLFELVAPEGVKIPKGSKTRNTHIAGAVQNGMKDMLKLEHQLECIDYTAENMVHADMSPEKFSKTMSDRGESFLGMMFKMMGQGMAQQSRMQAKGKNPDADMLAAFFSSNRPLALKRAMADQFDSLEDMMGVLGGEEGSTIITERNKHALEVLRKQMADGKKKLAIFYGAGHLADFETRLTTEFGLKRGEHRWLTAWKLSDE
jgi:hypothetical protein